MPQVTIRYFAGARAAAGTESEQLQAATLGEVKQQLAARPGFEAVCLASSFLVDGAQAEDDAPLREGVQVDVLPPFAGG